MIIGGRFCPRLASTFWACVGQTPISLVRYSSDTNGQRMSSESLENAKKASFWGLFVGDAMAMPVHWFYNPEDIRRGYGSWIKGYTAPSEKHPTSILSQSAIDGSGRSGSKSKAKQVIGDVILHDKAKYWTGNNRKVHYHRGMSAGDNTLNAVTALHIARILQKVDPERSLDPEVSLAQVMEDYVSFMTTPGSHNDTYAESFHRLFFKDWSLLDPNPRDGAEIVRVFTERYSKVNPATEDGQIPVAGALVLFVPWLLHYAHLPADQCIQRATRALQITHPAPSLAGYADVYGRLLYAVLHGEDLQKAVQTALESPLLGGTANRRRVEGLWRQLAQAGDDEEKLEVAQEAVAELGMACYIKGALTSLLFIAGANLNDFEGGVLMNTNCGGENVHRGAALAAVLGASAYHRGTPIPDKLLTGLNSLQEEIKQVVSQEL